MRHDTRLAVLGLLVAIVGGLLPVAPARGLDCGGAAQPWALTCIGERAAATLDPGLSDASLDITSSVSGSTSGDPVIQFLLDVTGLSRGYSQWITISGSGLASRCAGVCLGAGTSGQDTVLLAGSSSSYALRPAGQPGRLAFDVRPTSATAVIDLLMIVVAAIVPGGSCGQFVSPQALIELAEAVALAAGPTAGALRTAIRATDVRRAIDAVADVVPFLVHTAVVFAARRGLSALTTCLIATTANAVGYSVLWARIVLAVAPVVGLIVAHYKTMTSSGIAPTVVTARWDSGSAGASGPSSGPTSSDGRSTAPTTTVGLPFGQTSAPTATSGATSAGTVGGQSYDADWSGGLAGWQVEQGWRVVAGELLNDGSTSSSVATAMAPYRPPGRDYVVEAEIEVVHLAGQGTFCGFCSDSFGVAARVIPEDEGGPGGYGGGMHFALGPDDRARIITLDGSEETLDEAMHDPVDGWHTYRLEVSLNHLRLLIDGVVVAESANNSFLDAGRVGLWANGAQVSVRRFHVSVP